MSRMDGGRRAVMPRDLPGAIGEFHGGHDGCCAHTPTSSRRRYPERKEPMVIHAMRADDCHFTDFGWLQTYRLFSLSDSIYGPLVCRSPTCDGSFSSVTIRNLCDDPGADESPATSVFKGPIACTIPPPSGFVFRTARGTSLPKGAWSDSARYT